MHLRCLLFLSFLYLLVSAGGRDDDDDDAEWQSNGNWWNAPGKTPVKPTWKVISNNIAVLQNSCLWPPTHKYVYFHALSTTDNFIKSVDPKCPILTRKVLSCTSNQPDNGFGDGNTVQDCVYVPKYDAVCVRAERQGLVRGDRIYTIKFELTSSCWSGAKQFVWEVSVPHGTGWGNGWDWDKRFGFENKCTSPILNPGKAIICDPNLLPPPTEPRCPQMDCSDNNDCTADFCVEATGTCTHTTISCDDGNACTKDTCSVVGGCKHSKISCDDNNCCTVDSCSPATGCVHTPTVPPSTNKCQVAACDHKNGWKVSPSKVDCNDNDVCTIDSCDPKLGCQNIRRTDAPSVNKCQVATCDKKKGWQVSKKECNDDRKCTEDSCDATTGECVFTPKVCDDKSVCTADSCVEATGKCFFTEQNKPTANFCQMVVCDVNTGWYLAPKDMDCNDKNICTVDSCDSSTGLCLHLPLDVPHTPCQEVGCNDPGGVVVTDKDCTDNDVCTTDSCNIDTGDCVHETISCGTNVCLSYKCDPILGCLSEAKNCNDNNVCTIDTCDETGCVNTDIDIPVSTDLCKQITCDPVNGLTQTDILCPDDGLACTDDICVAGLCTHPPRVCTDSDLCTSDTCDEAKGGCVSTRIDCTDDNICDTDFCDSQLGTCVHVPLSPLPVGNCFINQCRDPLIGWVTVPSGNCPRVFQCAPSEPEDSVCKTNRTQFLANNKDTMIQIAITTLGTIQVGPTTQNVYAAGSMTTVQAPDNSGFQYTFVAFQPIVPFDINSPTALKFLEKVADLMGYHPDTVSSFLQLVVTPDEFSDQRVHVRINFLFGNPPVKRSFVDEVEANIPESLSATPNLVGLLSLSVVAVVLIVYVVKQRQ